MKKKGLIISTVVMVVVLIASLTTATYAWFTTSSVSSISGFNLEVVSSTAVKIGLKTNNTYSATATQGDFRFGSCEYSNAADGILGGTWANGSVGMGAEIDHGITYGQVTRAVGFTTAENATDATMTNTGFASAANWKTIVAANGNGFTGDLTSELAVANGKVDESDNAISADFAYLFLGVTPAKELEADTNKLYIVVQSTGAGPTLGLAATVHVAYRLNSNGEWTDVDAFGDTLHQGSQKTAATAELPLELQTGLTTGFTSPAVAGGKTTFTGASVVTIPLTLSNITDSVDQVEIIIYIAGADTDCVNGIGGAAQVGIFFGAQPKEATGA